ncbi:MAG: hypothetical protein GXP32_06695 [Kiritimatiellaeota bacterium]|nr:hypothetical protein [Kiritimatiellota bacterium]
MSLYNAMEERRHEDALRKIARLREVAPSDVFLANLETLEKNNSILRSAQKLIDSGDLKGASEFVSEGIVKFGRHELMKAKTELDVANQIDAILQVFKHPRDSEILEKNAKALKKIAMSHKPAEIFIQHADAGLRQAAVLRIWEKKCAVEGLCSQIASLLEDEDSDPSNIEVLYAVLEVSDPDNKVLKDYRNYISGKSGTSLNVYDKEDIFDSLNPAASMEELDPNKNNATEKNENTTPKESKKEEAKSGGWWKKFSF